MTESGADDAFEFEPQILLVEDDVRVRDHYVDRLQRAGFGILQASCVVEAMNIVADPRHVIDAAVLDYDLPDGTSLDLVPRLLDREPLCKSLVITGVGGPSEALRSAQLGAHGFIEKPVDPGRFITAVIATVYASLDWRRRAGQRQETVGSRRSWVDFDPTVPIDIHPTQVVARLRQKGGLTPIETLVAFRLVWGDTGVEVANFLGVGERTAKRHIGKVLAKTGAQGRSGLLAVLFRDGGHEDDGISGAP